MVVLQPVRRVWWKPEDVAFSPGGPHDHVGAEVNNAYREQLEDAGLVFSGTSPDGTLVEFAELPREEHPFYVATQAHPELRSRPTRPHPLFAGLVGAALRRNLELRLPVEDGIVAEQV